eukprot:2723162-Rhodomonas_salina.1
MQVRRPSVLTELHTGETEGEVCALHVLVQDISLLASASVLAASFETERALERKENGHGAAGRRRMKRRSE